MESVRKKAIPDVKSVTDPSFQKGAEIRVAIECHQNNKLSKETREYLAKISLESIQWKTCQELLDDIVLSHAEYDTPCNLPPNPTDEQRATERQRRLNALTTRHRIIFSVWPRDPQTEHVIKQGVDNPIMGKVAIQGFQLWGESLFDFYRVQRHPSLTNIETLSTSSKLLGFVKSVGEDYPVARPMVERAEREGDPRMIEPFNIARLIQNEEGEINAYIPFLRKKAVEEKRKDGVDPNINEKEMDIDSKGGEEANEAGAVDNEKGNEEKMEAQKPNPQDITTEDDKIEPRSYSGPYPIESLFDPSCYPEGWLREPFSGGDTFPWRITDTPPNLQQYLPQRLLPKKLIVHDPYGVLDGTQKLRFPKGYLLPMDDITHIYELALSTKYTDRMNEEDAEAEREDANAKHRLENFLAKPHSGSERPPGYEKAIGEEEPDGKVTMIYVVLPELPRPQPAKEAHLYLLPAEDLGVGHHSCVYNAEFEVPRSLLVKEELCMDCVHADVEEQLKERAADLKNAHRGEILTTKEITKPLFLSNGSDNVYLFDKGEALTKSEYVGPYDVVVQTRVGYQNLERAPYCQHFEARKNAVHPLTAKVSVAAKISIEDDDHLETEADNYQRFPKHFFEHWSGLNIIRPFHYPVPLGALVPQFYGYYVPEAATSGKSKGYLSPILLVEKCGKPIKFEELSVDDKQECAALLYRLHQADWVHNSVYERNILRQPGPLEAPPTQRLLNTTERGGYGVHWSYRLIDFGRSEYIANKEDRMSDIEFDAKRVIRWMQGAKSPFSY